jgi:hypothetical protein
MAVDTIAPAPGRHGASGRLRVAEVGRHLAFDIGFAVDRDAVHRVWAADAPLRSEVGCESIDVFDDDHLAPVDHGDRLRAQRPAGAGLGSAEGDVEIAIRRHSVEVLAAFELVGVFVYFTG